MESYCDREKVYIQILVNLHFVSILEDDRFVFGMPSVRLSPCLCASLPPEKLNQFYAHSIIKSLSILRR
jgi:hypothetical protein